MQTIRVETPSARYDVFAGTGLLDTLAPRIERIVGEHVQIEFIPQSLSRLFPRQQGDDDQLFVGTITHRARSGLQAVPAAV